MPCEPDRPAFQRAPRDRDALHTLVRARLVVLGERSGPGGGGKQVAAELVHDALLHRWHRLREWVREDWGAVAQLEQLELWALEGQEHGLLLDAQRLGHAEAVAEKYAEELSGAARELIERSHRHALANRELEAHHSEVEGMLGATQELLVSADADSRRAHHEIQRLRRQVRRLRTAGGTAMTAAVGLLMLLIGLMIA